MIFPRRKWKDIPGYEGLYQVSNLGEIKSLNYRNTGKEKIIKPRKNKGGYLRVVLCKNGKQKDFLVHRLVAIAFIPNHNNYNQVNHKDENPSNNNVNNLEWCTSKYNSNYGNRNKKLSESHKGKKYPMCGLKGEKNPNHRVVKCLTTGEVFSCISEASQKYDIHYSGITSYCRGKQKSAGKHPETGEKLIWIYL